MSTTKMDVDKRSVITHEFRVSFPHLFEAHSGFENQEPKYSLVMLFDKKTDLKTKPKDAKRGVSMSDAIRNACIEKWGEDKAKWPKNLRHPVRDGDEKSDMQGYAGVNFVTATSKDRPQVIDCNLSVITNEDRSMYAGCFARASLIAFAYDKAGNKGVAFALQNIQKLRDGNPFSGKRKAEDDFGTVSDGSDDESNYGETEDTGMGF